MKKDTADYVARYLTCQRVKIERLRPGGPIATISYSSMEIGPHYHGFYSGYAVNQ